MDTIKKLTNRQVAPALKKHLAEIYPGIVVKVRTKRSYGKCLSLQWIDGPSTTTMHRLVMRFIKTHELDHSLWIDMDRTLSMQGEEFFSRMFKAQTGLEYNYYQQYHLDYEADKHLFGDASEVKTGYQLASKWGWANDLPIY